MRALDPEHLEWKPSGRIEAATLYFGVHGADEVQVRMLRVPPGVAMVPRFLKRGRQFFCVLRTAGARLHLGKRVFRPEPGRTFECEPQEVHGVVNDTRHEVLLLAVTVGGCPDDEVLLEKTWEEYLAEERPEAPQLLTTSNPEAR